MKRTINGAAALVLLLSTAAVRAGEMSVGDIVEKANQAAYYAGKDGLSDVRMTIVDEEGDKRTRKFRVLRYTMPDGKDQRFYVYFTAPADVRKMAYLVWKHVENDDDRWLWLPALNLVKRIAPGDKRTSFVGSDFVYEDVSGRGVHEDKHELVKTTEAHYLVRNTPRDADAVEFSYYNVWIDKKTFLPVKAEYYDKKDLLYRRVQALEVREIEGFPTVVTSVASDLRSGSSTTNVFDNIDYNIGLDKRIFTERFLRRPPREATR